ncbi:MAG: hypothetical protein JW912_02785 [Sedimentisphaerales bacterium]|nr:hypothetical protein [Sedimentisphaerales bacterium]
MMRSSLTLIVCVVLCLMIPASQAAVTDNSEMLIVPTGETYTLDGTHTYSQYVNIEGTLYVTKHDGSGTTGELELIAPQITVAGTVDGTGRGFRGEGNYQEGSGCGGYPGGGGSYGGVGGARGGSGGTGGATYGTADGQTIEKGSAGGDTGGGLYGGGNGGAAITLQTNNLIISGDITANGTQGLDTTWGAGGASGGGILIITGTIELSGATITANGGRGGNGTWGGGGGGGGRIKIFYGIMNNSGTLITTNGGAGGTGSYPGTAGGAGTYYTEQTVVDNDDYLIIPVGQIYNLDGSHSYNILVQIDGTLELNAYNGSGTTGTLELQAPEITVSGLIDADGKGYRQNEGPGTGTPFGYGAGAGYGGIGGNSGHGGTGGPAYGTATEDDINKGSGGSEGWNSGNPGYSGGAGGGLISLNGSMVTIGGTITANGLQGDDCIWGAGGGSGGGILITSTDVSVSGTLSANGGRGGNSGGNWGGGGGAGGRIKIFYGCYIDDTSSTITLNGGAGGAGSWNGSPGQQGTYYTESDVAAPFRGYEATFARWEFLTDNTCPPADVLDNPYGDPNMYVFPIEPWLPVWGGREGVWPLSGIIDINIPNRPYSGPDSMKIVWLQIVWAPLDPGFLDAEPMVHETSTAIAVPAAKYPDCVLESFEEGGVPRNWKNTNYILVLKPNPDHEQIMIEGVINVDRIIVETICIPGLRTADLNGDNKVDLADFVIFASHWLDGTE